MSTETALVVVILLFSFAATVLLYRSHAQAELNRIARYEFWTDKFYDRSKALVSDADTPAIMIEIIRGLNAAITEKRAARALFTVLSRRRNRVAPPKMIDGEVLKFMATRPELAENFNDMIYANMMAVSYLDSRWGVAARALLADLLEGKENKAANLSSDAREVAREVLEHRHCDALLPA